MSVPVYPKKFSSTEITSARNFAKTFGNEGVFSNFNPTGALFVWHPNHFETYIKPLKPRKIDAGMYASVYRVNLKDRSFVVVTGYGVGGPSIAHAMEELGARGITKFINVGGCGGLEGKPGDFFVISKAIKDDGTSYHYDEKGSTVTASPVLVKKVKSLENVRDATIWTTDAMFRETKHEIERLRKRNVSVVDMETAAMYSVAKYRGWQAVSIVVVHDILGATWKIKVDQKMRQKNLDKAFALAIKIT